MQSVVREPACACVGSVDVLIRVHDNRLLLFVRGLFLPLAAYEHQRPSFLFATIWEVDYYALHFFLARRTRSLVMSSTSSTMGLAAWCGDRLARKTISFTICAIRFSCARNLNRPVAHTLSA